MVKFSLSELSALPTLSASQADDLKIENAVVRVWLSRLTTADGAPFDNMVTIEEKNARGQWRVVKEYPAE